MRSVLRKMKSLLRTSETKLTDAKAAITTLTEKVNKVLASLSVFRGLIEAAKAKEENLEENVEAKATGEILTGLVGSIRSGFGNYRKAKNVDKTMSVVNSILDGVTSLSASLIKVFTKPKIGPKVDKALQS